MVLDSAAGHKDPVETGIRRDEIMCSVATEPLQRGTEAGESLKLFIQAGRLRFFSLGRKMEERGRPANGCVGGAVAWQPHAELRKTPRSTGFLNGRGALRLSSEAGYSLTGKGLGHWQGDPFSL